MFEISVDLLTCDSPWKAAAGRRKRLRWATPSWLIDGSEMLDQVAPLSRSERAPFVWRYFFVIRSRLAISAAAVITSY